MSETIRVRGILGTADGAPASPLVLYKEGTHEVVAVGASDILSVDYYQLSHTGAGIGRIFFSDNGTEDAGSTIGVNLGPAVTLVGDLSASLPSPMVGVPGETVYASGADVQLLSVIITGSIYVS